MVHELDTANNYFCIYEKIKFAPFFLAHPVGKVFEEEVARRKLESKKMRFLQKKAVDTYLQEVFNQDAVTAMMIRTNMIGWIDDNYGGNGRCPLCGELDSTKHVFVCEEIENEEMVSVKNLEEGERMVEIVELFTRTEKKRREWLIDNIETNFDALRREGTL